MRLLFAHDHFFNRFKDNYYSTCYSSEIFQRYIRIFDYVVVVSRQKELNEHNEKMALASLEKVEFTKVPNFKSITKIYKIFEAKKIIHKELLKCDVLVARLPSSIGNLAIAEAKKLKKPFLVEVVGCSWDAMWFHSIVGKIIAPFEYVKMKNIIKYSDYCIYVTEKFLQDRYPTKGKNIFCSNVALKQFDNSVLLKRQEKISSMNAGSKIIIGTIAALNVRYKGQQYVIQALGLLKKSGMLNYEYHLVGGGEADYLRSIAIKYDVVENVKFLGTISHDKIFDWLDDIDIYAQPSRQEGLPRALIEAMSRGLPSFGANTGGIPELLDNEFIFSNKKNNLKMITDIINSLLDKEKMLLQSKRNYNKSKKYAKEIIEDRRKKFLLDFRSDNNV